MLPIIYSLYPGWSGFDSSLVIASEAKQSNALQKTRWIASLRSQ